MEWIDRVVPVLESRSALYSPYPESESADVEDRDLDHLLVDRPDRDYGLALLSVPLQGSPLFHVS